jgi:cytochrome c
MSTFDLLLRLGTGLWLVLVLVGPSAVAAEDPGLGRSLTEEAAAGVDFTVMPDGTGLPPGEGDVATGARIYQQQCQVCHGVGGQGGPNDRLVGGAGTLAGDAPVKTVGSYWPYATTVFDYIRRAMPYPAPGSLSADDVYALTAYLLFANGIVDRDAVMNARTLPEVSMPNRDGFVWAVSPDR